MKIAAFFDIDGTIFRDSLMTRNFKKLLQYEIISNKTYYSQVADIEKNWAKRYGEYDDYITTISTLYSENLKGINMDFLNFIADQTIESSYEDIYTYSRDRLNYHHKQGHLIFFISGSPDFLVSRMAKKYKATDYRGTVYIADENNNFSGQISKMWNSENKYLAVQELLEKYKLDLDQSYAYGDTIGDLSMLSLVGKPIAINPTKELLKAINSDKKLRDKTEIIVERKNIVYKLPPSVETLDL
ncbi:MAG: HAD-IB family hydrolase [Bacillota bacterium]|nr:HAD-IB family hydrolase [Bacillota bacterium]